MVNPAQHPKRDPQPNKQPRDLTRRDFVALSATASVAIAAGCSPQMIEVVEETEGSLGHRASSRSGAPRRAPAGSIRDGAGWGEGGRAANGGMCEPAGRTVA